MFQFSFTLTLFRRNSLLTNLIFSMPLFRKLFLSFFLLTLTVSYNLQAQVQLLLDPVNSVKTSSLFNLSLVNSGNAAPYALTAVLKSKRGKELMKQTIQVDANAKGISNVRGLQPSSTVFFDADFERLYSVSSTLPPLNYVLCVSAVNVSDQNSRAEECVAFDAIDFINIMPLYPSEEMEIFEQRPLFTWMDLAPQQGYSYNFSLVQLKEGQNAGAAMRRNSPLVSRDGLTQKQVVFPSDATPLENGQQYAWQLTLNYKGEKVATSDAWKFEYKEGDQYIDIPRNLSYVDITEIERGASLYAVGEFKFKYPSEVKNTLQAELFELKKGKRKKIDLNNHQFDVQLGINKYELDLKEQVYLKHLRDYVLILKDKQTQQSFQFTIKYVNPDYIK